MAKRKGKKRRSTAEKIFIVFSILIAISMVLASFALFAPQPTDPIQPGSSLPTELVYAVNHLVIGLKLTAVSF